MVLTKYFFLENGDDSKYIIRMERILQSSDFKATSSYEIPYSVFSMSNYGDYKVTLSTVNLGAGYGSITLIKNKSAGKLKYKKYEKYKKVRQMVDCSGTFFLLVQTMRLLHYCLHICEFLKKKN